MQRTLTLTLTVLLVVAGAVAPVAADTDDESDGVAPGQLVATYNANVDALPEILRDRVAGEQVELVVRDAGDVSYYHGTVDEDGRITDHAAGQATDPTVRVTTDEATLERIRNAENPTATAAAAYERGDVTVDGVGVVAAVEMTVAETAVDAGRALGLL